MSLLRTLIIALPAVQLPSLPQLPAPLPVDVNHTLSRVTDRPLAQLRRIHVRELLRTHRRELEADPQGAAMIRNEVLAFSPSADALDRALAAGFSVARQRVLTGLDARIVVLRAPPNISTRRALARLRELDPAGLYDFNHLYSEGGQGAEGVSPVRQPNAGRGPMKVGLVDGGVDATHPVFENVVIHPHGCGDKPIPSPHGTVVASLMAAPGVEIFAADIYCKRPTGGAMDDIAEAIAWIAGQHVPVINVSLVGPRNLMLQNVVQSATARGHLIVAAVGNDGPAAPPLYPAAYPDVIGVTAVDRQERVLIEACRGPQVDFAALGADMEAAVPGNSYASVRGTSFAAPIVAGLLAARLHEPDKAAADKAVQELTSIAVDLGARGADPVYGRGFVGADRANK